MRLVLLAILLIPVIAPAQKLKSMSTYVSNPAVSKEAQNFYKKLAVYKKDPHKYYNERNIEKWTTSILDSLGSNNLATRPFYYFLASRHLTLADGEVYSIALTKVFTLLQTRPAYFFRFMLDNPAEKKLYFSKWYNIINTYGEAYCPQLKKIERDTCLQDLRSLVVNNLTVNYPAALSTAREFFDAINIKAQPLKALFIEGPSDHGKTFHVTTDKPIKIKFRECRGCAEGWHIIDQDMVRVENYTEEFLNPSCTNCTGGMHDHIIMFRLKTPGKHTLNFKYFEEKMVLNFIVR